MCAKTDIIYEFLHTYYHSDDAESRFRRRSSTLSLSSCSGLFLAKTFDGRYDIDPMLERFLAEVRELATYWAYTGLERSDGCPKSALAIGDAYQALPRD